MQSSQYTSTGKPLLIIGKIVEDNLVNQRVMQKQLKNLGCVTYTANHGGEALDMLKKSTFWKHEPDTNKDGDENIEFTVVLMDQEMVCCLDREVLAWVRIANTTFTSLSWTV